jgi:putative inorganic carbon (HCO3(-)) transporter
MVTDRKLTALAEWTGIAVPAACAPFLLFPQQRWMWVLVVLPIPWLLRLMAKRRSFERTALDPFLLVLVMMVGISVYATPDVELSLGKIAGVLLGVSFYCGLSQFANTETRLRWVIGAFLAGGIGVVVLGLIGTAWWIKYPTAGGLTTLFPTRLTGLPGAENGFNPNAVGGALILFVPLLATLIVYYARRKNRSSGVHTLALGASLAILLSMGGTLLLCQSRAAWLSLCGALALASMLRFRVMRWAALGVCVAAVLLVLMYRPWVGWGSPGRFAESAEISLLQRVALWSQAVHAIQGAPFVGVGMNMFRKGVIIPPNLFYGSHDKDLAHCHNQLLQAALDLGIPGLVAYGAIWAGTLALLWRVWRHTRDSFHRTVALGLVCGLLAQFAFGITDAIALGAKVGIFWWIALALAASLDQLEIRDVDRASMSNSTSLRPQYALLMWGVLSLMSVALVGSHPYVALSIASAGGLCLGLAPVLCESRST